MPITKKDKEKIIKKFGENKKDTGSTEVQVAILSHRISELTEHVKIHKKDKHTRRGLVQLVSQRKKLLKYLVRNDSNSYVKLIKELSIRG
jgi:small subunit ribosomal protein S15